MEDTTMMDAQGGSQPLFEGLVFTIIPNSLTEQRVEELKSEISREGGTVKPFDASHGRIEPLTEVTHIISTTTDFPDYTRALDLMLQIVKPDYVEDSIKFKKIKNPRTYSPDPALFFSEVVICCGEDLPGNDKEAIEGGTIAAGGQVSPVLTKLVTHLIVLKDDDPRYILAERKRLRVLKVLPHWFEDCLRVGRRISERPYTFPNPEYLDVLAGPPAPIRETPQVRDAVKPEPDVDLESVTPPQQREAARAIKAFAGKKVKLSEDLGLSDHLKEVITTMIQAGGGESADNVEDVDMYICKYRDGDDYVKASQEGKDVGSLSWLYYLLIHDVWTNPMRRMMHYPRPRHGIPGFAEKKYKISISSYTGEARVYLESLIRASGAEFTKTFKQDNTHLITAHKKSEKCEAAEDWGVNVVNSLWLEESYSKCKEQTLTNSRYTYFPIRTNLGEILGQTEIDRDAVERTFFSKKRKSMAVKDNEQDNGVAAPNGSLSRSASDSAARSSPLAQKTRRTKTTDATTPSRRVIDGKENETPGTTGSRGAKSRAMSKLHEAAPDIARFEKEMKRKGGVVHGRDRGTDAEKAEKTTKGRARDSTSSKRSIDEVDQDDEEDDNSTVHEPATKSKKARKGKVPPPQFRMSVSKYEPWDDDVHRVSSEKKQLREYGLIVSDDRTDNPEVQILCAPKVVTTKKFLCAFSHGPTLVKPSFIEDALKRKKIPALEDHLLQDTTFEREYGCTLQEALERAKQNRGRLLRGWQIFVSKGLKTLPDFQAIIEANGGKVYAWNGRTTKLQEAKRPKTTADEVSQNQEDDDGDILYLLSSGAEKKQWNNFRDLAKNHDMKPRIVNSNWLTHITMAQKIYWEDDWELTEEKVKLSS